MTEIFIFMRRYKNFKNIYFTVFINLSAVLLIGCTKSNNVKLPEKAKKLENVRSYSSEVKAKLSLNFTREQTFGDTEKILLKRIRDFEVDKRGRIYIVEKSQIRVFDKEGNFLTNVGRKGKGPAEFISIGNVEIESDRLFAYDVYMQRLSIFSLDSLLLEREVDLSTDDETYCYGQFFAMENGKLLIGFEDPQTPDTKRYIHFYKLSQKGINFNNEILKLRIESNYRHQSGRRVVAGTVPFSRTTLVAVNENNLIYTAYTGNFFIKIHDNMGRYTRSFYYPYDKTTVNKKKFLSNKSALSKQAYVDLNLPETHPALYNLIIDDENRLWISTIIKDEDLYKWWVLGKNGRLLAHFTWPKTQQIEVVKNGMLYTIQENEQTGTDEIMKYIIKFTDKQNQG